MHVLGISYLLVQYCLKCGNLKYQMQDFDNLRVKKYIFPLFLRENSIYFLVFLELAGPL